MFSMKIDKSKSQVFRYSTTNHILKKQLNLQREVAKKYQRFKKAASLPAYFLNKSRLKKISDIYRSISLQKLSKNNFLNKSKSLYSSTTPQKKVLICNSNNHKKQRCVLDFNSNKFFQTNEKTKRLCLNKTIENQAVSPNTTKSAHQSATHYFMEQIEKLELISNLNLEKLFIEQYNYFFKGLKENSEKKGDKTEIKSLILKFCFLIQSCQDKLIQIQQKKITNKFHQIELDLSFTHAELKKKTLKIQLLIKEIDQLKTHSIKLSEELNLLKNQKKCPSPTQKTCKKHLQISNIVEIKVYQTLAEINSYEHLKNNQIDEFSKSSEVLLGKTQHKPPNNSVIYQEQRQQKQPDQSCNQEQGRPQEKNDKLEMIKRIRSLQKKQRELVQTLLVLKSYGIDVQKAFQQVISGQFQGEQCGQANLKLPKVKVSSNIKNIPNKDSYEADDSIIDSIDQLTVRDFEGEPEEQYLMYPMKKRYISKPLNSILQNQLRLNFQILYEDDSYQQSQNHLQISQNPTIFPS